MDQSALAASSREPLLPLKPMGRWPGSGSWKEDGSGSRDAVDFRFQICDFGMVHFPPFPKGTPLNSPFSKGNTTEFPLFQRGIKGDCRASEIKTATLTVNYAAIFDLISKKMRINDKNVFATSYNFWTAPCYSLPVYIIAVCSGG